MSSKENPLKALKKTPNGSGQSQLLPSVGCPSHLVQDSPFCLLGRWFGCCMSSSFPPAPDGALSGCACWEDVFPKQPALGAACGSQHSSMSHSRFAVCLSTHTTNTPTPPHWQGRRVFFLFLHRSCWLTLLPWLCGLSPGMDPEETAQVASPTLAVFKHILSPAGQQIPRVWGRMKL